MCFKTVDVAGLRLFYREAGDPSKSTVVLLTFFPPRRISSTTSFSVWRISSCHRARHGFSEAPPD